jgi:putative ABC transport system permease protein
VLVAGVAALIVFAHGAGGGGESDAPAASMILMLAVALLGPLLALPFAWLLGLPVAAVSRAPGMLARANTRANLRRAASVATPVMLAVSLLCTILFAKSALQRQTTEETSQRVAAGYVLRPQNAPGVPPAVAAAARRLPGIAEASGSVSTSVVIAADGVNLRSFPARGVDASTLRGVIDLGVHSGSLADLAGNALAVGSSSARAFGWHVGDRVKLWLGDGTPVRLRVAATYTRPLGFGEIVLPRALVERHVTHPLDDAVFVKSTPGLSQASVLTWLRTLEQAQPTVKVLTRSQYQHQLEAAADKQSLAVYVLLAVIGVFCAIALVNAMTMATAERAREFALLRLIGASKRQVKTMIRAETLIMVTFGLAIGSLIAAPGLAAFNYSLTGSAVPSVSITTYGGLLAAYALLGFAATVLPTRLALRMNPIKAMAARE